MIQPLLALLACQLAGEAAARVLDVPLPGPLAERAGLDLLSDEMNADFAALRAYLLKA